MALDLIAGDFCGVTNSGQPTDKQLVENTNVSLVSCAAPTLQTPCQFRAFQRVMRLKCLLMKVLTFITFSIAGGTTMRKLGAKGQSS